MADPNPFATAPTDQTPDQSQAAAAQPPQNGSQPQAPVTQQPQSFMLGVDELTPVDGTEKPAAPAPHKFAGEELTPIDGSERKVTQVAPPQQTHDLLTRIFATTYKMRNPNLPQNFIDATAKQTSDYIYNNILGKDTYTHNNLSYDAAPSGAYENFKKRFWGWLTQDEINKLPGLEPDRVEALREAGQDYLGTRFGKKNADWLREHILNGSVAINVPPEEYARAAAKTLTDFYSPGYVALSSFGRVAQAYQKTGQAAAAAGDMAKAAAAMGKARLLGLLGAGVNVPFAASQAHDLVDNWDKMSVPERVAAAAGILGATINAHVGVLHAGGAADHSAAEVQKAYAETGKQVAEIPKTGVGIAKDAGAKAAGALDTVLGRTNDFPTAIKRSSQIPAKELNTHRAKIKNVETDLQAIGNDNAGQIEDPKSFADAINRHIQEHEAKLQQEAGATRDEQVPVVSNIEQRLRDRLDKFFDDNRGKFGSEADVDQAKQDIMDRVLQKDTSVPGLSTTRGPNLFESENVRQGLNIESKPQYAANAKPTTDAYKVGAKQAADVLREAIDEHFNTKGVKQVKEWRSKESDLIDVRDKLLGAQKKAEDMGQPGIWNAVMKKYGGPSTIIAIALGTHNPVTLGALAPYLMAERTYQNLKNPIRNIQRAVELAKANPNATATEPQFTTPPPPMPPGTGTPPPPTPGAPGVPPPPIPPVSPTVAAQAAHAAAPAHMEEPPAAHELNATLATYFGDSSVQSQTLEDRLDRFKNEVEASSKSGVDLTPKQAAVLAKVHQAEAAEAAAVDDHQTKTAEEAQKKQEEAVKAHQEELKKHEEAVKAAQDSSAKAAEGTAKEAGETGAEERSKVQGPVGSHVAESTEPIQKTPRENMVVGHTDNTFHGHEYGHLAVAAAEGVGGTDFASHLHPDIAGNPGAVGGVGWQEHPYAAEENADEKYTPEQIWDNTKKWLRIYMGGAAANELLHGMTPENNKGLKGDMRMAKGLLEQHGIDGKDADIMIQQAQEEAKAHLQKPGVLDTIKANSRAREQNLPKELHASAGRVENFQNQVKGLTNVDTNGPRNNEGNARGSAVEAGNEEGNRGASKERRAALEGEKDVADHANEFNRLAGRPDVNAEKIPHSPETAARIAKEYEAMQHNPEDPAVKKSYGAAIKDINDQWNYAEKKMGIKFEPWTKEGQPYANSKEMTRDVKDNKHLYFFQGGELPQDHPLAKVDPETGLTYNDKLRAVHNLFGHAAHEFQFGPKGEENAWNVHRQMFSAAAIPAITTETRGQNSWVNFGAHLRVPHQEGLTIPPERTTGSPETDKAIKDGGAISAGIMKGDEKIGLPELTLFHDPTTGSTLALKTAGGVSPQAVEQKLADSRAAYLKANPEQSRIPEKGQPGYVGPEKRPFASQKAGLLPEEFHQPGKRSPLQSQVETKLGPEEEPSHWVPDLTKEPVGGVNPENPGAESKRYGFEIHPESRQSLDVKPTAEDFQKYADQTKEIRTAHPDIKLGWDTTGEGKPELNIGASTDDLQTALTMAKKLDQRALWDNKEHDVIDAGGKGERTEFPEYPFSERLKDLNGRSELNASPEWKKRVSETPWETDDKPWKQFATGYRELNLKNANGDEIGALKYTGDEGDLYSRIRTSHLDPAYQNQGIAKEMYKSGIEDARNRGIQEFRSDTSVSDAARHVWEALAREGYPVYRAYTRNFNANGSGGVEYTIPLQGQKITDADFEPLNKESGRSELRGSSVPLMENPLPVKGTMEGGEVGTLDLTKALNAFSRKQLPSLEPGSESKEMIARASKIAEDEAKYQLAQSKTGTEWYTTEMKDHDKVLQDLRPELATGDTTAGTDGHPVNLTLFKAAEAILSSGQKPYANVKSALKAWDAYKETGEFPPTNPAPGKEGMSWGPRGAAAYANAFNGINKLIADKGAKGAADWLLSEHPVSELKEYGENVSGKKTDMAVGAMILGEKRGPFMQNLHGIESKFTADMWVSRSWNRWMGTLDLDPRIEAKGKMTSESDAPRNNTERALMKESFTKAADKLGLTTSSMQAVLWYYEQALYRAHGLPVESWSFSDAAKRVAKEASAPPEAEQTGFNFGANEKAQGGLDTLSGKSLVLPSKFVNLKK